MSNKRRSTTKKAQQSPGNPYQSGRYEIRIQGYLDARWGAWFDGMSLSHESDGTTVIHGPVVDQAALYGLLQKVRDVGLPLVSVIHVKSDQGCEPGTGSR